MPNDPLLLVGIALVMGGVWPLTKENPPPALRIAGFALLCAGLLVIGSRLS